MGTYRRIAGLLLCMSAGLLCAGCDTCWGCINDTCSALYKASLDAVVPCGVAQAHNEALLACDEGIHACSAEDVATLSSLAECIERWIGTCSIGSDTQLFPPPVCTTDEPPLSTACSAAIGPQWTSGSSGGGCRTDVDCPDGGPPHCLKGVCSQCSEDSQCGPLLACVDGTCSPPNDCGTCSVPSPAVAVCVATACYSALVLVEQASPLALTMDESNVYWADSDATNAEAFIKSVPLNGGPTVVLAAGSSPQALAAGSSYLYWTDSGYGLPSAGTVNAIPKTGGPVVTLASGQYEPSSIITVGPYLFWANASTPSNPTGTLQVEEIPDGDPQMLIPGGLTTFPQTYVTDLYDCSEIVTNGTDLFCLSDDAVVPIPVDVTTSPITATGNDLDFGFPVNDIAVVGSELYIVDPLFNLSYTELGPDLEWGTMVPVEIRDVQTLASDETGVYAGTTNALMRYTPDSSTIVTLVPNTRPTRIAVQGGTVVWVDNGGHIIRLAPYPGGN